MSKQEFLDRSVEVRTKRELSAGGPFQSLIASRNETLNETLSRRNGLIFRRAAFNLYGFRPVIKEAVLSPRVCKAGPAPKFRKAGQQRRAPSGGRKNSFLTVSLFKRSSRYSFCAKLRSVIPQPEPMKALPQRGALSCAAMQ